LISRLFKNKTAMLATVETASIHKKVANTLKGISIRESGILGTRPFGVIDTTSLS
jgi:hypothetical protein